SLCWIVLLAATALVGAFAYWTLQAGTVEEVAKTSEPSLQKRPKTATSPPNPGKDKKTRERDAVLPVQVRLAAGAAILFLLTSGLLLLEQAATAADVSLAATVTPAVQMLSATQYGRVWIVQEILGMNLLVVLALRRRPSRLVAPPTLN